MPISTTRADYIVNPHTKRMVKIGSRVWNSLVKEGYAKSEHIDPAELEDLTAVYEEMAPAEIEEKIKEHTAALPRGQQAVRGRGKYKGKIVRRNQKETTEEISRYTAQMAAQVFNNNIDALIESEDIEAELQRLILQEMTIGTPAPKAKAKPVRAQSAGVRFETQPAPESSEDEGDEGDYYSDEQ